MSKIIVDVEQGAAALFHDLTEPPSDGSALPPEAVHTALAFADRLGLDRAKLGPVEVGHLFDTINHAVEAIGEGNAEPGAAPDQGAPAEPAANQPGPAAVEPGEPPAPESAIVAAERVVGSPPAAPLNPGEPPHGPAVTDLPPVTAPDQGNEICPKCAGFRTILEAGAVTVCPECKGSGQVAIKAAPAA